MSCSSNHFGYDFQNFVSHAVATMAKGFLFSLLQFFRVYIFHFVCVRKPIDTIDNLRTQAERNHVCTQLRYEIANRCICVRGKHDADLLEFRGRCASLTAPKDAVIAP